MTQQIQEPIAAYNRSIVSGGTSATSSRTCVSAVLAVRNEERHIGPVLDSLLLQSKEDFDLEVLVIDGASSDRTRMIAQEVASRDDRVRLLYNPRKRTPYAFNLGITSARGHYIAILGAHTTYAPDYIETCLKEMRRTGAAGCSGRELVRPGGPGLQPKLVAWALAHPFGTSTGSMRTRGAGFADSLPYPVFLKQVLLEVGGYNNELHRNQDNDLCQRLRARGHTLYITDKTFCEYFVSPNLLALIKYAFRTGFWNYISLRVNAASMALRHLVPGVFSGGLLLSVLLLALSSGATGAARFGMRGMFVALVLAYSIASLAAACHIAVKEHSAASLLLPVVFFALHFSYGMGTLTAMARNAKPSTCEAAG